MKSPGEKHSYEDCGEHHLKRANQILKFKLTKILWNGESVKKLEFHTSGEDGEFLWIGATLDNKDKDIVSSYYMKGTV